MADYAIKVTNKNAPGDTDQAIVGTPEWAETMFTPARSGRAVADYIDATGDCWEWTGAKSTNGYGSIRRGGKAYNTHRYVYEALVGPIPEGMQLDHLCRNRACVNPDHLEPVTQGENLRRGVPGKYKKRRTHCFKGHELTYDNVLTAQSGDRRCRTCRNELKRRLHHKGKRNG